MNISISRGISIQDKVFINRNTKSFGKSSCMNIACETQGILEYKATNEYYFESIFQFSRLEHYL